MSNPIYPTSQTPQQITLAKLRQMLPEAFSENQLDISKLTALLSKQDIAPAQEAYGLNWAGKHQVYRELKTPTSQTLVPQPDESVNFDTSQNLFIEGDNLAVLKILQKSYHNRIKMIYIDPPYNTGNDRFVYADDFSESIADYKARAGQTDEDGNLTHSDGMRGNRRENGQYHSNWLNMMYPRLALAKSLLRDDGVIFVSIDDNEVANLRLLMDEIFGEENFVAEIVWQKKYSPQNDATYFSLNHEQILCYARNLNSFERNLLPLNEEQINRYKNPDNDKRGVWKSSDLSVATYNQAYDYEVTTPSGRVVSPPQGRCWNTSKENLNKLIKDNRIWFGKDGNNVPSVKKFLTETNDGLVPISLWGYKEVGHTQSATQELKKLMGEKIFDHPKPIRLIQRAMKISSNSGDIILDFFAGSSTTAHAVMALNTEEAENGEAGNRKFIMVQIPEAIDAKDNQSAYEFCINHNMPPNIAEISKERIRRAAAHIESELPESVDGKALDFGFKAYRLSESNFIPWQQPATYDADSLMAQLEQHLDPIADNATTEGILTELTLKEGYTLTATIVKADGYYLVTQSDALNQSVIDVENKALDSAGTSMSLAIVLDDMTTDKATQIIASAPNKTLIMDRAFSDDANKANIVLQFEDAGLVVGCV